MIEPAKMACLQMDIGVDQVTGSFDHQKREIKPQALA